VAYAPGQLIAELIGEAFIDAIQRSRHRTVERARAVWQWLREVGEPPDGVELVAPDGARYTGVAVLERSRVVLIFAVRHAPRSDDGVRCTLDEVSDAPFADRDLCHPSGRWRGERRPFRP
jgi:hypothetical protein